MTKKTFIFRALIVLWGLGLGLVCAEAVCKFIDLREASQYRRISGNISRPSRIPGVRFELIPGTSGVTPDQTKVVRVNSHGFRGPGLETAKPTNAYRMAVLGDSIAFGRTLDEDDVFPYRIPGLMQARVPGWNFEIINASLSGRDTWEEVALLEHRVLALDPDLVIIQVCLNDHIRFPPPDPGQRRGAFGEKPWYSYSSLLDLLDRKLPGFRKWHVAVATRLGFDMRSPAQVLEEYALDMKHIHNVAANWPQWHKEFLRANELCRAQGVRFMIAVFPTARLIEQRAEQTVPELTELARQHGIPLVDLLDVYRGPGSSVVLTDYTHPTPQGHQIAAEYIAAAIDREFFAQAGSALPNSHE